MLWDSVFFSFHVENKSMKAEVTVSPITKFFKPVKLEPCNSQEVTIATDLVNVAETSEIPVDTNDGKIHKMENGLNHSVYKAGSGPSHEAKSLHVESSKLSSESDVTGHGSKRSLMYSGEDTPAEGKTSGKRRVIRRKLEDGNTCILLLLLLSF